MEWHRFITLKVCQLLPLVFVVVAQLAAQTPATQTTQQSRYRLVDLGTFGGPASYFPMGLNILNNHGTAVGSANLPTTDPLCFFAPNCFNTHAFQVQQGILTDLGALPGGSSDVAGISANGLIAGRSWTGEFDPVYGLPEIRAVLWRDGQMIDLGLLTDGGLGAAPGDINDRGQVVGTALNTVPDSCNIAGLPTQFRAFLWQNGVMQDLGTLGGSNASAFFINDRSQVTGISFTDLIDPRFGCPFLHTFFWQDGAMLDIGTLGGSYTQPNSMNQRGEVVGFSLLAKDEAGHGFLWSHGQLTDLETLGGCCGEANWINDRGDIVGNGDPPGPAPRFHAVLWKNGKAIDLGVLPGDSCSNAFFVNSHGQVVGTSESLELCLIPEHAAGQHAFLWEQGGPMVDLNGLIPSGASLQLTFALSINDHGVIAGIGVPAGCAPEDVDFCGHAYVLIPCGIGEECVNSTLGDAAALTIPFVPSANSDRSQRRPANPMDLLRKQWRERSHLPVQRVDSGK